MPDDEDDDFEEVDPDLLEDVGDDPVIEAIADEATSVGMREDLIEALRESDGSSDNPLALIGEAAAELPEGIDAMFDRITMPTEPPPALGDTDPAPAPAIEDPDDIEFRTFMDRINKGRPKPPES
jgi:hypothetical protein